jgi:hypothetical protein
VLTLSCERGYDSTGSTEGGPFVLRKDFSVRSSPVFYTKLRSVSTYFLQNDSYYSFFYITRCRSFQVMYFFWKHYSM